MTDRGLQPWSESKQQRTFSPEDEGRARSLISCRIVGVRLGGVVCTIGAGMFSRVTGAGSSNHPETPANWAVWPSGVSFTAAELRTSLGVTTYAAAVAQTGRRLPALVMPYGRPPAGFTQIKRAKTTQRCLAL
jgi:hypothetical protein